MVQLVRGCNEQAQKNGLPTIEVGIGISYQDSAPMYLVDGNVRIMISSALNESDRLSSCHRAARKQLAGRSPLFNVFSVQAVREAFDNPAGHQIEVFDGRQILRISQLAHRNRQCSSHLDRTCLRIASSSAFRVS